MSEIRFSVLMPTYNQCAFIRRAILSLMQQTYDKWELIIINDGCTDETEEFIADYLADERITYIKNEENTGLGHALNQGLDAARYDYIAYLPSDDFYFPEHLAHLTQRLENQDVILAFSGIQFEMNDTIQYRNETQHEVICPNSCLQLVQVAHKKIQDIFWTERSEFLTEDLFLMFWHKLVDKGYFLPTNTISAFWTTHPTQRHRLISEKYGGGLNIYRSYYKPRIPLRLRVSKKKYIDESQLYKNYRKSFPAKKKALKILLVGELAYNPERIYALEEAGCQLYGLWMPRPIYSFATVGPLPFGNVKDVSYDNWKEEIEKISPDLIYGLLNSAAVPFVYETVNYFKTIPFIWHFKEGPSACLKIGCWDKLISLYHHASGRIYLNETTHDWYAQFLPPAKTPTFILDGDLPKVEYFSSKFSPKLSELQGGIHTVVTGRLIGITDEGIRHLAENDIHVHLYTENYYEGNGREDLLKVAPNHFHIHGHVSADKWTEELSQYDAGWLHGHRSTNNGNLMMATWDDLNLPARISTYAAAGIPILIPNNSKHIVASNRLIEELGIGILYDNIDDVVCQLKAEIVERGSMNKMIKYRYRFCFDYHVSELLNFFRKVIIYAKNQL